jgi:hypothetical protein
MSRTQTLVAVVIAVAGCGGGNALDAREAGATTSANQCRRDPSVVDGGPGACGWARAYIDCEYPNGAGCSCMTDDTTCSGCGAGATCTDKCSATEYAVSCGSIGPGNPSITYADAPAGCRSLPPNPGGISLYCCPCL